MARFDPNRNRNRNRNAEEPPSWVVTASPPNAQENPEASKSGLETHSSALHGVCSSCYGANGQLGSVALLIYSCPRTFIPSTDPEGRHGTDKWQKKGRKKRKYDRRRKGTGQGLCWTHLGRKSLGQLFQDGEMHRGQSHIMIGREGEREQERKRGSKRWRMGVREEERK